MSESEKLLYGPVMRAIQGLFSKLGECELEITAQGIPERVKAWLGETPLLILKKGLGYPDLIGLFKPDLSKKPPFGFPKGLIVVEVKNRRLGLRDVAQAKSYAEAFGAYYAFLISTHDMSEEMRRFLVHNSQFLLYPFPPNVIRTLYIGKFDPKRGVLEEWFPVDPFRENPIIESDFFIRAVPMFTFAPLVEALEKIRKKHKPSFFSRKNLNPEDLINEMVAVFAINLSDWILFLWAGPRENIFVFFREILSEKMELIHRWLNGKEKTRTLIIEVIKSIKAKTGPWVSPKKSDSVIFFLRVV